MGETVTITDRIINRKHVIDWVRGDSGEGEDLIGRIERGDRQRGFDTLSAVYVMDSTQIPEAHLFDGPGGSVPGESWEMERLAEITR